MPVCMCCYCVYYLQFFANACMFELVVSMSVPKLNIKTDNKHMSKPFQTVHCPEPAHLLNQFKSMSMHRHQSILESWVDSTNHSTLCIKCMVPEACNIPELCTNKNNDCNFVMCMLHVVM